MSSKICRMHTQSDAQKSGANRFLRRTVTHTAHLEHTAKRRKRASPTRRRRRRRRHRNARSARTRHQAAQRPCRTRRPAYTTCHAGAGSSGPAADGHRWPTTAGRRSRAVLPVRSRSSAAWPRASARASAVIPSTPAAILRTRSTLSPPVCHEREAQVEPVRGTAAHKMQRGSRAGGQGGGPAGKLTRVICRACPNCPWTPTSGRTTRSTPAGVTCQRAGLEVDTQSAGFSILTFTLHHAYPRVEKSERHQERTWHTHRRTCMREKQRLASSTFFYRARSAMASEAAD